MQIGRYDFGHSKSGELVEQIVIGANDLNASILTWGAIVQDLRHAAWPHPLVLGLRSVKDYENHSPFFGATVGRVANRIGGATFELEGTTYHLDANDGRNSLHGGLASFGKRNWIVEAHGDDFVILALISKNGEGGYPGTVSVRATFRIVPPGTVSITYEASTDAATPLNMAHHSYFTLRGDRDTILDHIITLPTTRMTETADDLIPTGAIIDTVGTDRDYTDNQPILSRMGSVLDNNFCIAEDVLQSPMLAAQVHAPEAPLRLECWSDQPGMQVYCGHKISVPVQGLGGKPYGAWSGLCLEPQIWPDAVNHAHFPNSIVQPGDTYRQQTEYRFIQV